MSNMSNMSNAQIPVTVLTGYLGAGKSTLLNRILTERHGKRYAVFVNECGEVGIDNDLVVDADEEVFEMNNGCIRCSVRGDLIRIPDGLMKRKDKFDAILIETTGLSDPGPVVQTFFVDEDVRARTRLDAIVTMADAKHLLPKLCGGAFLPDLSSPCACGKDELMVAVALNTDGRRAVLGMAVGPSKAEPFEYGSCIPIIYCTESNVSIAPLTELRFLLSEGHEITATEQGRRTIAAADAASYHRAGEFGRGAFHRPGD